MYKKIELMIEKKGISVYQLSKETGIPQTTISSWKTGKSKPKVDKLKLLANYFGVSIEYFLE